MNSPLVNSNQESFIVYLNTLPLTHHKPFNIALWPSPTIFCGSWRVLFSFCLYFIKAINKSTQKHEMMHAIHSQSNENNPWTSLERLMNSRLGMPGADLDMFTGGLHRQKQTCHVTLHYLETADLGGINEGLHNPNCPPSWIGYCPVNGIWISRTGNALANPEKSSCQTLRQKYPYTDGSTDEMTNTHLETLTRDTHVHDENPLMELSTNILGLSYIKIVSFYRTIGECLRLSGSSLDDQHHS